VSPLLAKATGDKAVADDGPVAAQAAEACQTATAAAAAAAAAAVEKARARSAAAEASACASALAAWDGQPPSRLQRRTPLADLALAGKVPLAASLGAWSRLAGSNKAATGGRCGRARNFIFFCHATLRSSHLLLSPRCVASLVTSLWPSKATRA
jgi:hypothetical protein